ncbi:unnamed protein product, partial [Durusdinium trenchii]
EVVAATKAVKPAVAVADSSAYQPVHFHVFAEEDPTFMLDCPNALCYISFAQEGGLDPIPSPAKSAAAHGGDAKSAETPTSPRTPASLKAKDAMKAEASRYV